MLDRFSTAMGPVKVILQNGQWTSEARPEHKAIPLVREDTPPTGEKPSPIPWEVLKRTSGIGEYRPPKTRPQRYKAKPKQKEYKWEIPGERSKMGRNLKITKEKIQSLVDEGLNYRQIGERLGCSHVTVHKRLRGI